MSNGNQSQTRSNPHARDAAIQIPTNNVNPVANILERAPPRLNGLIEWLTPVVLGALLLTYFR